eukprot:6182150-Amphidinium_carterae.1
MLPTLWANKSLKEAHAVLERPDVTVTNTSDKEQQLKKLESLNDNIRRAFKTERKLKFFRNRRGLQDPLRVAAQAPPQQVMSQPLSTLLGVPFVD